MAGEVPNILEEIQKLVDKSAELDRAGKAEEADKLVEKIKDLGGNFVTKARKLTEEGLNADEGGHKEEAVRLYREAVGVCLEAAKTTQDREMKRKFSKLAGDALERAEMVKEQVEEDFRAKKNSFQITDGGKKIKSDVEALATHYDQFRKRMEAEDAARKAKEEASKEEPEGGGGGDEKIKDKPGEHFKNVYPWNKLDKITCVHCKESDTSAGQDEVDGSRVTKPAAGVQRNKSVKKLKDTFEKDSSCQCTTDESANEKAKDKKKDETKEMKDDNDLTRKKSMEKTKNKLQNLNFTGNANFKPVTINTEKEDSSTIFLGEETNVEPLERKRSVKEAKSKLENLNFKPGNINRKSSEKEEGSRISLGEETHVEPLERKRSVKEAKSKLEKINFSPLSPTSLGEELGKGTSIARRRSMKETKNQLEKINLCPTRSLNFSPKSKPDLLTNMARSEGPGDHVESEDAVPELPAIPQLQHLAKNRPKRNKKHAATKSMVLRDHPTIGEMDDIAAGLEHF